MQRVLVIAAVTLLLDQLSKWAILEAVMPPRGGIAITGFFNVVLTYNTGVSFGLFQGEAAWQPYFLIAVNLVVSLALLVWVRKQDGPLLIWAVGLVVGGAVGNAVRSEEHTSELQSLMRISYAVFCLKKQKSKRVS